MANVIASQAVDRAQELQQGILALQIVIKLYMNGQTHGQHAGEETIFVLETLLEPLVEPAEDLLKLLRGVSDAA